MPELEFGGVTVEFSYMLWRCPGCGHGNRSTAEDAFEVPTPCEACEQKWQACPSEDCYGDGPDCLVCGGNSGGLVRVEGVAT